MNQVQIEVDIAGHTKINWNSGATATLVPKGEGIEIQFEYKPTGIKKEYVLVETVRNTNCNEKRGMILR